MSIKIGKNKNLKLSKYLVFEIFSYVYSDYQAIQVIINLGKQGAKLVLKNREILTRITQFANQSSAINFHLSDKLSLKEINIEHLSNVNIFTLSGSYEFTDEIGEK